MKYTENVNWSNEEIEEMAKQVGVSFTKIYKWNWERKKKERQCGSSELLMNELV